MSDYSNTSSPKHHAWEKGDVVRLGDWPFADAVVMGFNDQGRARLCRPYLYVTQHGGPPLVGYETMEEVNLMFSGYRKVASGRIT